MVAMATKGNRSNHTINLYDTIELPDRKNGS